MSRVGCVLLPLRAQAHWHLQLGSGAAGVRKKRRAHGARGMCGWWWRGGGIGSPSRCGSLSGSHLPAPWIPQTQVLPPQPPLSSTHGDPQAILSPSGEDCCSQTLLPIWDTSRESTRQTWPCPQPRECLEGKEASPSPEDLRVLRLIPWELKEDQKQMKIASLTLTPSHGGNDSQHSHGALSGSGVF